MPLRINVHTGLPKGTPRRSPHGIDTHQAILCCAIAALLATSSNAVPGSDLSESSARPETVCGGVWNGARRPLSSKCGGCQAPPTFVEWMDPAPRGLLWCQASHLLAAML